MKLLPPRLEYGAIVITANNTPRCFYRCHVSLIAMHRLFEKHHMRANAHRWPRFQAHTVDDVNGALLVGHVLGRWRVVRLSVKKSLATIHLYKRVSIEYIEAGVVRKRALTAVVRPPRGVFMPRPTELRLLKTINEVGEFKIPPLSLVEQAAEAGKLRLHYSV